MPKRHISSTAEGQWNSSASDQRTKRKSSRVFANSREFATGITRLGWHQPRLSPRIDRKSTRLNSSHSQISYAVFCLKKKKNNILSRIQRKKKKKLNNTGQQESN